jgi:ABC-type multidrug transport system ATPase subunit
VAEAASDSIELRDMNEAETGTVAMRLTHLTKTFFKYPFGITSKSDVTAVKDLSLDIGSSELFTLLGHNGAGKSTLISMLVGILAPSSGSGLVSGLDIEQDMQEIRRNLGYCPQHDILWEELTAMEHLLLFSQLKGRSRLQAATESKAKLTQVSLFDVKDALVGTFSGGMKRRLSVAIASIGDPAVMIMDEPTTGMDPLSKREVWELIKQLKRDRCILLTTHSMEEADILSDRIAIITNGKLQCCGSSLRLKNSYGRGYRLSIISSSPALIKAHLTKLVPETQVLSESAGSLILTVPQGDSVLRLLAELEGGSLSGVEDWSISHTTLEEVFMRVTGELIAL